MELDLKDRLRSELERPALRLNSQHKKAKFR